MTEPEKPKTDVTTPGWTEAEKQVGAAAPPGDVAEPVNPTEFPSTDRSATESAAARIAKDPDKKD